MSETFTVTAVKYAGEKDNPHGGKLHRFYCSFDDEGGTEHQDVYWQRKSRELEVGEEFYGHIEQGEYGPRFKTDQQAGNFKAPAYSRSADGLSKDDYWRRREERDLESQRRQGRAHAQQMALRFLTLGGQVEGNEVNDDDEGEAGRLAFLNDIVHPLIDWFEEDVDASGEPQPEQGERPVTSRVGKGEATPGLASPSPEEASPAQKRKLTTLFNEAGLARGAQQAIVLFRCKQEKATKNGASQLIQDLIDGATAEALLAEISDARNTDPFAVRAAQMIPSDVPADTTGLAPLSAEDQAKYAA